MSGRLDDRPRPPSVRALASVNHTLPPPCYDWNDAMDFTLKNRDLDETLAVANYWYPSEEAGDEEPRIVIPATGELVTGFWQARAMDPTVGKRWQSPHGLRGDAIVVVYPHGPGNGDTVVVEGPMDALAAAGLGYLGISLLGATPPMSAIDLTRRMTRGKILLVADSDSPATMAGLVPVFAELGRGVRLVVPTVAKDLAAHSPDERKGLLA